jgi:hypothetical protein
MRRQVFMLVCTFCTLPLLSAVCFAQTSAPRDPSAVAAIQAAVLALGGKSLQGVDNCVAQGQMTKNGTSGTFKWENSGSEFRYEQNINGVTTALVSNHGSPATIGAQVEHWPSHFTAASLPPHLTGVKASAYSSNQSIGLALLANDPVADAGVFRVQVSFPQHPDSMVRKILQEWRISQSNGLPLAVRQQVPGYPVGSLVQTSETDFSNYQKLGGFLVPTHIEQYLGPNLVSSYDFSTLQCGVAINASDFAVPAGAQ